jgi:hypothetical protein
MNKKKEVIEVQPEASQVEAVGSGVSATVINLDSDPDEDFSEDSVSLAEKDKAKGKAAAKLSEKRVK